MGTSCQHEGVHVGSRHPAGDGVLQHMRMAADGGIGDKYLSRKDIDGPNSSWQELGAQLNSSLHPSCIVPVASSVASLPISALRTPW